MSRLVKGSCDSETLWRADTRYKDCLRSKSRIAADFVAQAGLREKCLSSIAGEEYRKGDGEERNRGQNEQQAIGKARNAFAISCHFQRVWRYLEVK